MATIDIRLRIDIRPGELPEYGKFAAGVEYHPENVIGRAVRLYRARADRDFTVPVGLRPEDQDLTSVPGPVWSEAFKMSVRPV